jgi:UDP-glucose 4-epimerase
MFRKKVLLTGATGLVGSTIGKTLKNFVDLKQIVRIDNTSSTNTNDYVQIDLMNKVDINSFVRKLKPDYVIHCAAQIPSNINPDSPELAALNSKIDENIFSAIDEMQCQFIYMSSTSVYGFPNCKWDIDEGFPVNPQSFYSIQKIKAENQIIDNIENGLIFRLNAPYGLNMRVDTVMNLFIKKALNNLDILIHGSGSRMQDFTNSRDIADFIYDLIYCNDLYKGIYNISSGQPISMAELAKKILSICKSNSLITYSDFIDNQEFYKASFSISKAKLDLNWNPRISIENGIREIILNCNNN